MKLGAMAHEVSPLVLHLALRTLRHISESLDQENPKP